MSDAQLPPPPQASSNQKQAQKSPPKLNYSSYLQSPIKSKQHIRETLSVIKDSQHVHDSSGLKFPPFEVSEYLPKDHTLIASGIKSGKEQALNSQYSDQFYEHVHVNQQQIHLQLQKVVIQQAIQRIDQNEAVNLPQTLKQNKEKWAICLLKDKKLQNVMCRFNDQVAKILDDELATPQNSQLVHDYLKYPHSYSPEASPRLPVFQSQEQVAATFSNLKKAKAHLSDLSMRNQRLREEAKTQEELDRLTNTVVKNIQGKHFKKGPLKPMTVQKKKTYKHPMALQLRHQMDNTNELLQNLEQNQDQFKSEVKRAELELSTLDNQTAHKDPGGAINGLLEQWSAEPLLTNKQIDLKAAELWKSKDQFERELREDAEKTNYKLLQMKMECHDKITMAREQCTFRMDAAEKALEQIKIRCSLDVERAQMKQEELASTLMNLEKSDGVLAEQYERIDGLLKQTLDFNTPEGQNHIKNLVDRMKTHIITQQQAINIQIKKGQREREAREATDKKFKDFINTFTESCEFAQHWMMVAWRIADESRMFNKESVIDDELKLRFRMIRELDDDIHRTKLKGKFFYQENIWPNVQGIHQQMTEIDLPQMFNLYVYNQNERNQAVNKLVQLEMQQEQQLKQAKQQVKGGKQLQKQQTLTPQEASQIEEERTKLKQQLFKSMTQHVSIYVNEKYVKPAKPQEEIKNEDGSDHYEDRSIDSDLVYQDIEAMPKMNVQDKIKGGLAQKLLKTFGNMKEAGPKGLSSALKNLKKKQKKEKRRSKLKDQASLSSSSSQQSSGEQDIVDDLAQTNNKSVFGSRRHSTQLKSRSQSGGNDSSNQEPAFDEDGNTVPGKTRRVRKERSQQVKKPAKKKKKEKRVKGIDANGLEVDLDGNVIDDESSDSGVSSNDGRVQSMQTQQITSPLGKESNKTSEMKGRSRPSTKNQDPNQTTTSNFKAGKPVRDPFADYEYKKTSGATNHPFRTSLSIGSQQDAEQIEEMQEQHGTLTSAQAKQLLLKYRKELSDTGLIAFKQEKQLTKQNKVELVEILQQTQNITKLEEQQLKEQDNLTNFLQKMNQIVQHKLKKRQVRGAQVDVVRTDLDALGQLHGFSLQPDITHLLLYQSEDFEKIKATVKSVCQLNQVLAGNLVKPSRQNDSLDDDLDFEEELGDPVSHAHRNSMSDQSYHCAAHKSPNSRAQHSNLTDPAIEREEARSGTQQLKNMLFEHIVNINSLQMPSQRKQLSQQMQSMPLSKLLQSKIQIGVPKPSSKQPISPETSDLGTDYGYSFSGYQYLCQLIENVDRKVQQVNEQPQKKDEVQHMLLGIMQSNQNQHQSGTSRPNKSQLSTIQPLPLQPLLNQSQLAQIRKQDPYFVSDNLENVFNHRLKHELDNTVATMDKFIDQMQQRRDERYGSAHHTKTVSQLTPQEHSLERIQTSIKSEFKRLTQSSKRQYPGSKVIQGRIRTGFVSVKCAEARFSQDCEQIDETTLPSQTTNQQVIFKDRSQSTNTGNQSVSTYGHHAHVNSADCAMREEKNSKMKSLNVPRTAYPQDHSSSFKFPRQVNNAQQASKEMLSYTNRLLMMPSEQSMNNGRYQSTGGQFRKTNHESNQLKETFEANKLVKQSLDSHFKLLSPTQTSRKKSPVKVTSPSQQPSHQSLFTSRAQEVNGILRKRNKKVEMLMEGGKPLNYL